MGPLGIRVNGVASIMTYTNFKVTNVLGETENRELLYKMVSIFSLNK